MKRERGTKLISVKNGMLQYYFRISLKMGQVLLKFNTGRGDENSIPGGNPILYAGKFQFT